MADQKVGRRDPQRRRNAGRFLALALLTLALGAASSCIKEDNTVTWYLDPNGQVVWSVLERNIRSDASDRRERQTEEQQFIVAARVHQHPAMTGLQRLGATNIKDSILQDKPPYSVLTEGQFPGLEMMGRRLLAVYGMTGTSVITRDAEKWTWTLTIEYVPEDVSDQDTAELTALLGDGLHVALREGEFVEGDGFTINDDKRLAELSGDLFEPRDRDDPPKKLQLTWRM